MEKGSTTWDFTYNADGLRTRRTNGTKTYDYVYCGNQLMYMQVDGKDFLFSYTPEGVPMGITYLGTAYYYLTNMQGDVVGILNNQGELIVSYSYDAWGNILSTQVYGSGTNRTKYQALANYNPLRYRGYVYDSETEMYYVCSRYYNSELGRWISPEPNLYYGGFDDGAGLIGYNVYAYCANNPVVNTDSSGQSVARVLIAAASAAIFGGIANAIGKALGLKKKTLTALTAGFAAIGLAIGLWKGIAVLKTINKLIKPLIYFFRNPGKVYFGLKLLNLIQFEIHNSHHNKPIHFVIRVFLKTGAKVWEWWFGK